MSHSPNANPRTSPIPIVGRNRSSSIASSIPTLSNSPTSPLQPPVQTPSSYRFTAPSQQAHHRSNSESSTGGSPTSPLAYFLGAATSPIRSTAGNGYPFTKQAPNNTAIEEEDDMASNAGLFGMGAHTRRGSWAQNGSFAGGGSVNAAPATSDRGVGVLRRLSLSGAFQRPTFGATSPTMPSAPPPSAVAQQPPTVPTLVEPKPGRRSRGGSLGVPSDPIKKRGISPMGERLLKGHFDGFI